MISKAEIRTREIIKYNIIGVVMNALLSLMKIIIGTVTNAHAVVLDGVNGLSDMTSSVLSILSAYFGSRKASRKHPLGFGRLEYIFSMIITIIIIYIGIDAIVESVKTLLNPHDPPEYNLTIIIIMCISLIAKMIYGIVMRKKGKELDSIAMKMEGAESCGDALIAAAILAAIAVYKTTRVDIEHYLCIAISMLIITTGVKMVIECMVKILGGRADPEYKHSILNLFLSVEGVKNVSNLVLHNYGEKIYVGSVDIEVNEKMPALKASRLSRKLIRLAANEGLTLTSVGICAANTEDPKAYEIIDNIIWKARNRKEIAGVNSFVIDFDEKVISFYAIPELKSKNPQKALKNFADELIKDYPGYDIEILNGIDM